MASVVLESLTDTRVVVVQGARQVGKTTLVSDVVERVGGRLHDYRDHGGAEVDLLLETGDGRIAGLEVKATASVTGRDVRWLAQLRESLGARFVAGVVLHTGATAAPFGDRIAAVPMDALWA